jgi:hypothetical protein
MGHSLLRPLAAGLAAAALTELLIMRTFTRTAVHIPAIESMAGPYEVISDAGRFAYFVTVVLLLAALPALALMFAAGGERRLQAGAAAIVVFLVAPPAPAAPTALTSAAILPRPCSSGRRSSAGDAPCRGSCWRGHAAAGTTSFSSNRAPGQGDAETVRAFHGPAYRLQGSLPLVAGGCPLLRGRAGGRSCGLPSRGCCGADDAHSAALEPGFTDRCPPSYGVGPRR